MCFDELRFTYKYIKIIFFVAAVPKEASKQTQTRVSCLVSNIHFLVLQFFQEKK